MLEFLQDLEKFELSRALGGEGRTEDGTQNYGKIKSVGWK